MKPTIVVGVDFSTCAAAALQRAIGMSKEIDAAMEVVHVIETSEVTSFFLNAMAVDWLLNLGVDPGAVVLRTGIPWIELTRRARAVDARFVVVGIHGSSGRQPVALGSTASRIAVAAPCPVLLVKAANAPETRSREAVIPLERRTVAPTIFQSV